jgi:short-subunit dehydrogenase
MAKGLHGRVAIITGASSGIGRETALAFARAGVQTALAARREDKLEEVAQTINALGGETLVVPTDISQPAQVQHLVQATLDRFGRIDVLVNNAGFGLLASVEETSIEDMQRIMEVNFMGAFYAMKAVLPVMRQQGRGHIINVASIVGKRAVPYSGAYCATKFALVGFSETLRIELAGSGIDVSVVCPIWTETEFFDTMKNVQQRQLKPVGPAQSAAAVARAIVDCVRHPRPEVMPFRPARLLAVANAIAPGLIDRGMRQLAKVRRLQPKERPKTQDPRPKTQD